jgi:5-formyltetrahydrofolate cyclo-ligase
VQPNWTSAPAGEPSAQEPSAEPPAVDMVAAKALLRSRIRAARRDRAQDERELLAGGVRDVALNKLTLRPASLVACYLNGPTEPHTDALRSALTGAGVRVLLPVVAQAAGEPVLDWAVDDGTTEPGPYFSIPEPAGPRLGPEAVRDAEIVFVPALAVDTLGRRLGQGGGYYDRALATVPVDARIVAIVHDDEVLDADVEAVPALAHDRRVDAVLTPSRWISIRL